MNETKDRIIGLLTKVNRPGTGNVIRFLEESNFFTAKCHRHHKYRGGLADHSLEVCENMMTLPDVPEESAILVGLLHDIGTAYHRDCMDMEGHGRRSAAILADKCHLSLTDEEREAILLHMHPTAAFQNRLLRAVSLSDNISAMFEAIGNGTEFI